MRPFGHQFDRQGASVAGVQGKAAQGVSHAPQLETQMTPFAQVLADART
jgi:hypothetical protein